MGACPHTQRVAILTCFPLGITSDPAARELFEETGQTVEPDELIFKTLVEIRDKNITKYRAVYYIKAAMLTPFIENDEMAQMKLWNLTDAIGDCDAIDAAIVKRCTQGLISYV